MEHKKLRYQRIRHIINAPFIWFLLIPLVILDVCTEIYHQVGFRLCGIPLVKRSNYIVMDRHKLSYLNFFQKLACAYCGYANGLMLYLGEIAARSEIYWCGIMHQKKKGFIPTRYHRDFLKYGDEAGFRKELEYSNTELFYNKWDKNNKRDKKNKNLK
jgi:hypothetical protein